MLNALFSVGNPAIGLGIQFLVLIYFIPGFFAIGGFQFVKMGLGKAAGRDWGKAGKEFINAGIYFLIAYVLFLAVFHRVEIYQWIVKHI